MVKAGPSCQRSARAAVLVRDREGGREGTLWTYERRPSAGGTTVTESYEVRWIPWWMHAVDAVTFRHRQLLRNMAVTLAQLKATAEAPPA